jgi:hypothetical protein
MPPEHGRSSQHADPRPILPPLSNISVCSHARRTFAFTNNVRATASQRSLLAQLLELYGFCLPPGNGPGDNPHDTAPLPPELFAPACRRDPPRAADCWLHWDGRPGWQLLRALRANAATPGEWKARGHLALEGRAISREGDAKCAAWVRAACTHQLSALPTTAQEDEAELVRLRAAGAGTEGAGCAGTAPSECLQLAVAWRLGYKRLLERGARLGL